MTDNHASSNHDPLERTLEVLLYAPIGIGLFLKDTAPTFVNMFVARGRAEIDRRQGEVSQRVTTARGIGQVAIAFGPPMVRQKIGRTLSDAKGKAEGLGLFGSPSADPVSEPITAPEPASAPHEATAPSAPEPEVSIPIDLRGGTAAPNNITFNSVSNGDATASAELPIPGYDALSASQVVERLIGLAPNELDAVHAYESTHRQRRTILGKIEQLAG